MSCWMCDFTVSLPKCCFTKINGIFKRLPGTSESHKIARAYDFKKTFESKVVDKYEILI